MSLSARLRDLEQRFGVGVPEVSVVIAFRKSASQVADSSPPRRCGPVGRRPRAGR